MGDRGNIVIKQELGNLYFYSHWSGSILPIIVQQALQRKQRWNDPSYLARIIFCELLRLSGGKNALDEETGYGIDLAPSDNEHNFVVVDMVEQQVYFANPDKSHTPITRKWSFADYAKLSPKKLLSDFAVDPSVYKV